jgi:excisionase family DNA binding protein
MFNKSQIQSPWLSITEAEAYARVRHGVIRQAVARGEIQSYRVGDSRTRRVHRDDIDEWITRGRVVPIFY